MVHHGPHRSLSKRISTKVLGRPQNIHDPSIFHKLSLIALLSWIGLGADGLSSSSYGPAEAFEAMQGHAYLAVFLAVVTALTVFIISYTYSKIIEQFPHGGGGYFVATSTLGKKAGVVSGSALLIDYVLTITVSIAACGDAIFSFLPGEAQAFKLTFKVVLICILILLNLRGVKESVMMLAPIFLLFIGTHVLLLGYGLITQATAVGSHFTVFSTEFSVDVQAIGFLGVLAIFLRAFSLGAGTYTGIEAVSNGLLVMREPKVKTGKRTMLYMAISLALVSGALLLCYYFLKLQPVEGQTLNAVLATTLFSGWPAGFWIAAVILFSEGLLLFVAAQTGFIDGPRVMANMAVDSWFPKKFAALSERLTMRNGVLVMGVIALLLIVMTNGNVSFLVIMYAINVFVTFSLSQLGMARFSLQTRTKRKHWMRYLFIFIIGFVVCFTILLIMLYEKVLGPFVNNNPQDGIWGLTTLLITSFVILLCYLIHRHYTKIKRAMKKFDEVLLLSNIHLVGKPNTQPVDSKQMTAAILVSEYNGYGVNTFLSLIRNFPGLYKNIIFVSIAELDSGTFKGVAEIEALKTSVKASLAKYVSLAQRLGFSAEYRMDVGIDVVDTASCLCDVIAKEFPKVMFFTAKLVFRHETIFHKILHNETAFAIQRRLQWQGLPVVVLPQRIDV
ncbi:MAG: APC family permease [Candidatus Thermoplasmatota archaeon]|nr:APC family permease [Candidatus Thermoplasmatota archaeon]